MGERDEAEERERFSRNRFGLRFPNSEFRFPKFRNPQFSEDHNEALATVGKMAGYEYQALYFGHGEPVFEGASALVADLAESQ